MRAITLDELQPGMYLSQPLLTADGKVLLNEGIEIQERYLQYLRKQGITTAFIGEPTKKKAAKTAAEPYDAQHIYEAITAARETITQFRVGHGVRLDRAKDIVNDLISQLHQNPQDMMRFLDIRRKEEYMFSHAINTCILAIMTGLALGYNTTRLEELGLAALFHDIGKVKFNKHLAMQYPDYLSKNDREEYQRHPLYSLEILQEDSSLTEAVSLACFQHHERWNGSGYPLGLKGTAISEIAQIISIADVYDRLIAGMPHRKPTPVYYAVAILNKAAGEHFNPDLVAKFTQSVAIYPMGKMVRLNNHEKGIILGTNFKNKTAPIVRITSSSDITQLNQLIELDLAKNPNLFIVDFEEAPIDYAHAYAERAYVSHSKQPLSNIIPLL